MIRFIKSLFCKHYKLHFFMNLYGDQINVYDGNRSLWTCVNCHKTIPSPYLHHSQKEPS